MAEVDKSNISSSTDDELKFAIARNLRISPGDADKIIKAFVESFRYCLTENSQVHIKKFGMVYLKKKKQMTQKNFEGKTIIQDCYLIRFLAASSLRDMVHENMRKKKIEKESESAKINLKGN